MNQRISARLALAAGALLASLSTAFAAPAATDALALAQENWRESIARTVVPAEGCFEAEYPTTAWTRVACTKAPDTMYLPHGLHTEMAGDGTDYAAATANLTTSAVGSFPVVTGVTSEKGGGMKNVYSIQLNSNFMTTSPACGGRPGCLAWQQFAYSSLTRVAFMQYWLIHYGTCDAGWSSVGDSCWRNSAAIFVPKQPIGVLSQLKLSGTAVAGGNDTLVFTTPNRAYSTSGPDSVTYLATAWNQSEFNLIGDGNASKAVFNKGSHVTVKVQVTDGSSNAPTCTANAGTTAETNNLNLGPCQATGGAAPYIQFTESN